jgi:hypothetical protein
MEIYKKFLDSLENFIINKNPENLDLMIKQVLSFLRIRANKDIVNKELCMVKNFILKKYKERNLIKEILHENKNICELEKNSFKINTSLLIKLQGLDIFFLSNLLILCFIFEQLKYQEFYFLIEKLSNFFWLNKNDLGITEVSTADPEIMFLRICFLKVLTNNLIISKKNKIEKQNILSILLKVNRQLSCFVKNCYNYELNQILVSILIYLIRNKDYQHAALYTKRMRFHFGISNKQTVRYLYLCSFISMIHSDYYSSYKMIKKCLTFYKNLTVTGNRNFEVKILKLFIVSSCFSKNVLQFNQFDSFIELLIDKNSKKMSLYMLLLKAVKHGCYDYFSIITEFYRNELFQDRFYLVILRLKSLVLNNRFKIIEKKHEGCILPLENFKPLLSLKYVLDEFTNECILSLISKKISEKIFNALINYDEKIIIINTSIKNADSSYVSEELNSTDYSLESFNK